MKSNTASLIVGAMLMAIMGFPAHANSIRCGKGLASVGDSKVSVLQKCGEPQYKDSYCKPVIVSTAVMTPGAKARHGTTVIYNNMGGNMCIPVDEWTYVPAPGQFMSTLRFESNGLTSITSGDRVPY